ncbi:MAG: DUF5667 domain-containing protein [Candidatus Paceibacteria bacterium]
MFYNDIKEKLNKLKQSDQLNPDEQWKQENKEALLAEIEQESEQESATLLEKAVTLCDVLFPRRLVLAGKMTVFIFFIVFAAIGGWSVTVQASYSSVPGDTLYNVKLAAEQAKLTMAKVVGSEADEAELYSEFAARRAQEAKKIIKNKQEPKQAKETIERMNESLNRAQNSLKRADGKIRSTQEILSNNKLIQDTLSKILVDSYEGSPGLADDIIVVKGEITEGSLSILEYMVRSRLKGDVKLNKEEIRALVVETISALSSSDIESDVNTDVLDKSAVKKIASGVVNKVEKQNGSEIKSGLKQRVEIKKENNDSKDNKKETESTDKGNTQDKKKQKDKSKEKDSSQDKKKQQQDKSSSKDKKGNKKTTSTTTGTVKGQTSTSSSEKSIALAKKLAQKGKLLKAIQTAQEVSSKNQKELLKLVGGSDVKRQKKDNGDVLVEFKNEDDETITTTIQGGGSFASESETSTTSSPETDSTTTEKKQESGSTKEQEETKEKEKQNSNGEDQSNNKKKKEDDKSQSNQ